MKIWLKRIAFAGAVLFLVGTVVNASWLAPKPKGAVKPIAQGGLAQLPAGTEDKDCTAGTIEPPVHGYLENTVPGIARAAKLGAPMIAVDVLVTKDGRIALFGDESLDCRTDGSGPASALTLAQLKALDTGHGYRADGGESFPFRGKSVGAIPSLEEALAVTGRARLLYRLRGDDPREADRLVAALKAAGRDFGERGDAFTGEQAAVERVRELIPEAWAFTQEEGEACASAYIALGWSGYVPGACRGGTMIVPLDGQWALWGWPNRMIARMEAHGTRIVITGPDSGLDDGGLDLPEQLGEIPADFNGYAMVADGFAVIPALTPRFDDRKQAEIEAVAAGLEARRAAR